MMGRINTKLELMVVLFVSLVTTLQGQITYPIVDTDVSEFYSDEAMIAEPSKGDAFYGQDANYTDNVASYTDHGDGTVTDNVTGLMWQQGMGAKISYSEAVEMVKILDLGGHSDWRIPTIKELYSLANFTGRCMGEAAIDMFIDTDYFEQPIGDVSLGEREIDGQTWSKTHYVGLTMKGDTAIFGYNFVDGRLKGYPKYNPADNSPNTMYFRMVRGNESYGINNFSDNGDGTITDNATGLMWQQADDGNTYDWGSGLAYAEVLTLGEHSDWRMPNAKELQSIVDYNRSPETTSSPAIDPLFSCTPIIDTDGNSGQFGYYWSSSPLQDGPNPYTDAVYFCFGKAQGVMNNTLMDVHGAGAQRNDPKSGSTADFPDNFGPQGDVRYVYNFVRCVRNAGTSTGILTNKDNESNYEIAPNPAINNITIISKTELVSVSIYNSIGRKVMEQITNQSVVSLNVSMLPNGVYIISLVSDNGLTTNEKLIISK